MVTEFVDATPLLGDGDALRTRMREDGHLFLRQVLDPAKVIEVRRDALQALGSLSWLDPGPEGLAAHPLPPVRWEGDEHWWDGYAAVLSLESFNRLAHEPVLVETVGAIVQDDVLVHPRKIGRITYPGGLPTPPHQDFPLVQGATDTITIWIPLGDVTPELGGLRLLAGSHRSGLRGHGFTEGIGGHGTAVDESDPAWRTTVYHPGDALVFMSFTVHWAPPNQSDQVRISVDYRYQAVGEPVAEDALQPHMHGPPPAGIPGWDDLAAGWSTTRWIDVPEGVTVVPREMDTMAVRPTTASRFVAETAGLH